jgi:outer membrane protein assembly factor BamB
VARSSEPRRLALIAAASIGCSAPQHRPHHDQAGAFTLEVGRAGASLRGVAGDRERTYVAFAAGATTTVEARRGATTLWQAKLDGAAGPIARTGELLVVSVSGAPGLRGEPGAEMIALDAATGTQRWRTPIDATMWSVITALAPLGDGVVVGGSFDGTLRADAHVVSTAGGSDGFVARIGGDGKVTWLVRIGGAGADAVQGVAALADRIAIAGTFAAGADVLGQPLPPYDERSPASDGFVGELDTNGARRWVATFGGKGDDNVAGVAIDTNGRVAVAANAREVVHVGTIDLVARGAADGLVAWWQPGGQRGPAILLGGNDFDGLRAITAVGDRVVVGGFYSGAIQLADHALAAAGGDDAFLAALDADGNVVASWHVGGDGREEITALAPVPDGFIAGIAHTAAAAVDDVELGAPADPMTGAAIAIRGVP